MSRSDITLTIGARLTETNRISNQLADEMERAAGGAGDRAGNAFGSKLVQSIADQEPRIARAMEKTVTTVTRVNELSARHAKNQEQVREVTEEIADINERINRLKQSGLDTDRDVADLTVRRVELQTQLNRLEQASISLSAQKIRANRDHTAALRQVLKAQDDTDAEGGVGAGLLTIGKMISALRAVAVPVGGGLSAIFGAKMLASASIATQALWMIPAAAAAAAAGIGSVSLATTGFGDAIKDIGDPEKFAEALQNLSPNAQQAALAIQSMMPQLTELKNATQDAFFADGSEMLLTLSNTYLPMIQQLTTGIAGAFNKAFKGIFDELMNPSTQLVFQSITDNLVAAFDRLADAAGPFSQALLTIIDTGVSFLPEIANGAANAAEAFAQFISEASSNGDLQRWFEEGLWAVGQLWDGIKALAKAFADLAPIGQESLPSIISMIETFAMMLPPIVDNLASIVPAVGSVADAVKFLGDTANQYLPQLPASMQPFVDVLNFVRDLIDKLGNSLKNFSRILMPGGAFLDAVTNFANRTPFGSILGSRPKLPGFGGGGMQSGYGFGGSFGQPDGSLFGRAGLNDAGGTAVPGGSLFGTNGLTGAGPEVLKLDRSGGLFGGSFGSDSRPTAGIAPPPPGGFPVPAPPADKGSGGGGSSKEKAPPFTADPNLYSLDSVPIGGFLDGTGATGAPPAVMAPTEPLAIPDLTRANRQIDAITAIAAMSPFNLSMTSDVRNEPKSWHHVGQAGDFSNSSGPTPEMHAFAMYMAQNFGHLIEELIYSDPVRGDVLIGGGRPVGPGTDQPNYYDAATRAQHMNHVHIAVTDAMAPYLEAAMQGNQFAGMAGDAGYFSIDQQAVIKAENDLDQARATVEEKRLAYLKLQQSGDADQLQLLRAKNDIIQAEANYREREAALAEARMGKYKELDNSLTGAARRVNDSLGQVGAALADDFGLSEGLPGVAKWLTTFLANLAFAPAIGQMSAMSAMSPIQGGHGMFGMMGAQNIAAGRSPLGLSTGGMMTSGLGFTPTGMVPGAPLQPSIGPAPLGGGVGMPLTGGIAPHGMGGAPGPQGPATAQVSRPPSPGTGGGFNGLGDTPMAAISTAISAGSMALDAFAPGAGAIAGQVAQTGIQAANRTAAYLGQVGGIAASGLMETFLPNSSEAGDPSKSWLGRIASGISGARPALPNNAGTPAPAQQPQQGQGGGGNTGPMVNIESMVNQTPDSGQSVANQIGRMQMSAYAAGGPR